MSGKTMFISFFFIYTLMFFILFFFFSSFGDHRYLHSFPTRRSSDLLFYMSWSIPCGFLILATSIVDYYVGIGLGHMQDRSEEHTSELQSRFDLVCRLLLEKKKKMINMSFSSLDIYSA